MSETETIPRLIQGLRDEIARITKIYLNEQRKNLGLLPALTVTMWLDKLEAALPRADVSSRLQQLEQENVRLLRALKEREISLPQPAAPADGGSPIDSAGTKEETTSDGLPRRSASELSRDLRARAAMLTGEKFERTATAAMMREAADMIEKLSASEWQPIATAPADADVNPVLLFWPYWSQEPVIGNRVNGIWWTEKWLGEDETDPGPTNWMPLPDPPSPKKRSE